MNSLNRLFFATALIVSPASLLAAEHEHEHRKHVHEEHAHEEQKHETGSPGSHVHGEVLLNLVLEGNEFAVELISPAMNIVGFEHEPNTPEQEQAVTIAANHLGQPDNFFTIPEAAGCRSNLAEVESSLIKEEMHEEEHHHHAKEDHGEGDHEEPGEGHSEFHVTHEMHCDNAAAIDTIAVKLFGTYPGIETVKVQWIRDSQQGAMTVNAGNPVISLK